MRSVLVTGGAGFIGSAIARALLERGVTVAIADNLSTGRRENLPAAARFLEMDLSDPARVGELESFEFDSVFHLAAQSSGEASFTDPWYDFNSHSTATFQLLELCRRKGVRRFLYGSSMSVYGDAQYLPVDEAHPAHPKTYYAAGKLAAEAYLKLYGTLGIATTAFRMFSVYGPGQNMENRMQGMASIYLSFILENRPIVVKGAKDRFRDLVYVDDVVNAWLTAWDNPASHGQVYNLGTGVRTTVGDLLTALTTAAGQPNYPIEFASSTPGDQHGMVADVQKLSRELGWQPSVDLATGISRMTRYYQQQRAG
ncbi:MAG: NAD-dependent epimerase/dehydratase family protein [Pseudomonadota bacterium]